MFIKQYFFSFPFKNPELLKKWVISLKRKKFTPTTASRLYSHHFTPNDYVYGEDVVTYRKVLKPDAVPSVFNAYPSYYQPKPKKIRKERNMQQNHLELNTTAQENVEESSSTILTQNTEPEIFLEDIQSTSKVNVIEVQTQTSETVRSLNRKNRDIKKLRHKVRMLNQTVKRKNIKISNLKALLTTLKRKGLLDDECYNNLLNFEGITQEIFKNEIKNKSQAGGGRRYSLNIKKFALTLHYYSPKAYVFCR